PALKAGPLAAMMMTLVATSSTASSRVSWRARIRLSERALRASGRFSVMVRTPESRVGSRGGRVLGWLMGLVYPGFRGGPQGEVGCCGIRLPHLETPIITVLSIICLDQKTTHGYIRASGPQRYAFRG